MERLEELPPPTHLPQTSSPFWGARAPFSRLEVTSNLFLEVEVGQRGIRCGWAGSWLETRGWGSGVTRCTGTQGQ